MKNKTIVLIGAGLIVGHIVLRSYRKKQPKIHIVNNIPGNFNAVTLPPFGVFITSNNENNSELLSHEMVHWQQYQKMGLLPYYTNYLKQLLFHGYDLHPMEQEARQNESAYCQTNYTECIRTGESITVVNQNFRKTAT